MLLELMRSPAVVDMVLLVMLLAWLGGSALMTLRAGRGANEHEAVERRSEELTSRVSPGPRTSSSTMPPQAHAADSLRP